MNSKLVVLNAFLIAVVFTFTGSIAFAETVATPTIYVSQGTEIVTMYTSTIGATIRYTLDGTEPIDTGMESPAYTSPITVSRTKTIKAKAFKAGMNASAVATYTFSADTTPPVRSYGSPTPNSQVDSVTAIYLHTNEMATCRYSRITGTPYDIMDSSTTPSSTTHIWQLSGLSNGQKTYYIRCKDAAGNKNTDDYIISFTVSSYAVAVATPTFSPPVGTYASSQTVTISTTTTGATIRYTLDGTTPIDTGMESPAYINPITISSTKTIKAKAFKAGMAPSAVASATYTIAAGTPPDITSPPTPVSTNSLSLKPGWNQISSPIAAGIDIATIEQSCTIVQYKNQKLWAWNAAAQPQSWTNPARVEPFKGYWIYAAYVCTVPLSGAAATFSSLQLYKGWNKISASGSLSAIQGTCAGHIIGNWVWNLDSAAGKWTHPTTMQLDKGYWIRVDTNCVLGSVQSSNPPPII